MNISTPPSKKCLTTTEPIGIYERNRNIQIAENERFLKNLLLPPNTNSTTANINESMTVQNNVADTHGHPYRPKSTNNCGVHTFIRILTLDNKQLQ